MTSSNKIPDERYGILEQNTASSSLELAVESIRTIGYAIISGGFSPSELDHISSEFDKNRNQYIDKFGEHRLRASGEYFTVRSPLTHGSDIFIKLALNSALLAALKKTISGKFILNQQNGIINPARESYNQGAWHRDLPYQHFVSSRPLAINALFCLDDFTCENGATFVLPASHKFEALPSNEYIQQNAVQVQAKSGSFILLDCMIFHCGGFNGSSSVRRAINHVFTIPYFKQQINIPFNMQDRPLSDEAREILGFNYGEPGSIAEYLASRASR
jgi:ectoine hydroxylase-related dioxygenase (phytanoyl-CoA dioxygenase family)